MKLYVLGVPGIHNVSMRNFADMSYLDRRQQNGFEVWDYKRETKPDYDELPGGRIKLGKSPRKRARKDKDPLRI